MVWVCATDDIGDAVQRAAHLLTCVYYVLLAILLFLSMRGHLKTKYYFGFLDGQISKAFFLLFCANLVWPINIRDACVGIDGKAQDDCKDTNQRNDEAAWFPRALCFFMILITLLTTFRICLGAGEDSNRKDPMMEDEAGQAVDQTSLM